MRYRERLCGGRDIGDRDGLQPSPHARPCPGLLCDMSLGPRRFASTVGHAGRVLLNHAHACGTVSSLRRRSCSVGCQGGGPVAGVGGSWPFGLHYHGCPGCVGGTVGDCGYQHLRGLDVRHGLSACARPRTGSGSSCSSGSRAPRLGGQRNFVRSGSIALG